MYFQVLITEIFKNLKLFSLGTTGRDAIRQYVKDLAEQLETRANLSAEELAWTSDQANDLKAIERLIDSQSVYSAASDPPPCTPTQVQQMMALLAKQLQWGSRQGSQLSSPSSSTRQGSLSSSSSSAD